MKFEIVENLDDNRIITFLNISTNSSVYHHPAWLKAITKTFGHKGFYIIIKKENDEIVGLVPITLIKSFITGKRILSLPFSTYCDPLLPGNLFNGLVSFLHENFRDYYKTEFRSLQKPELNIDNHTITSNYVTNILELKSSPDELLKSLPKTSIRQRIIRTEINKLTVRFDTSKQFLNILYLHISRLRINKNLPPLPYTFYHNILEELKKFNLVKIGIVEHSGITIGAALILLFKDKYYIEYSASSEEYLHLFPNHKLYWEIIKLAYLDNAKFVDFGRSLNYNQSLINFKKNWNSDTIPLHYIHIPQSNIINSSNSILIKTLQKVNKILPRKIIEFEGKIIYPHLG